MDDVRSFHISIKIITFFHDFNKGKTCLVTFSTIILRSFLCGKLQNIPLISLRGRLRNKVNVIRKRTRLETHKINPFSNTFNPKH